MGINWFVRSFRIQKITLIYFFPARGIRIRIPCLASWGARRWRRVSASSPAGCRASRWWWWSRWCRRWSLQRGVSSPGGTGNSKGVKKLLQLGTRTCFVQSSTSNKNSNKNISTTPHLVPWRDVRWLVVPVLLGGVVHPVFQMALGRRRALVTTAV